MRRWASLAIAVVVAACGGTATSPSSASSSGVVGPADFSGLWTASLRYTACTGERHCVLKVGTTSPFQLRIQETRSRVDGVFVFLGRAVNLEGDVLKDGTIHLSGNEPAAGRKDWIGAGAVSVNARLDESGHLAGDLSYAFQPQDTFGDIFTVTGGGTIESATRSDLATLGAGFDGVWRGYYVVRTCTPVGNYCYPTEEQEVTSIVITVAENGSSGTGTVGNGGPGGIPVTAQVSGTSMSLEGELVSPSSGGDSRTQIYNWSSKRDVLGRLSGSFDIDFAWPANGTPKLGGRAHAELVHVVKDP